MIESYATKFCGRLVQSLNKKCLFLDISDVNNEYKFEDVAAHGFGGKINQSYFFHL